MHNTIRWGILGTGRIAANFAKNLAVLEDAELAAVGSRALQKAQAFADEHGARSACGSYEELVASDVDVVYVSTPHSRHREDSLLALNAGKAVLCEKPFAINLTEVNEMIAAARANNVFLMEAMWTWCFPAAARIREWIDSGAIGGVLHSESSFCFRGAIDPKSRLYAPELGGGALLDLGVYNVAFAQLIHGSKPADITASAHIGTTGVDEQTSVIQRYPGGAHATHTCAIRVKTDNGAAVYGTEGWIEIPGSFWQPKQIILHRGTEAETLDFDLLGTGMAYEAQEVMRCLREGRTESEILPLQASVDVMETLDRIREQIGLRYPMDD